jgi:hypothetical protein
MMPKTKQRDVSVTRNQTDQLSPGLQLAACQFDNADFQVSVMVPRWSLISLAASRCSVSGPFINRSAQEALVSQNPPAHGVVLVVGVAQFSSCRPVVRDCSGLALTNFGGRDWLAKLEIRDHRLIAGPRDGGGRARHATTF